MSYLTFIFGKHPPPERWDILDFEGKISENLDTPMGEMTGLVLFLPRAMPNIILYPAKDSAIYSAKSFKIKNGQELRLEGDFNKYFSVYSIPGYEVFALEVLSPEFMQTLKDSDSKFIVFIALNCVYLLFQESGPLNEAKKEELKKAGAGLAKNLQAKLLNWSDADAEQSTRKMLDYNTDDSVRVKGRQMDYRIFVGLVVALFFDIILLGTYFTSGGTHTVASFAKNLLFCAAATVGIPLYVRYWIGR